MRPIDLAIVALAISVLGCGQSNTASYPDTEMTSAEISDSESSSPDRELNLALAPHSGSRNDGNEAENADGPRLERRIIYRATLELVVENLADVAPRVHDLARRHDGFIAQSSIDTASGRPRSGSWTIRVPVARYAEFLDAAGSLGELQRKTEDSREVTAEYYDLETRIRNKRVEEERLLKHLTDSTGKLEDILAVEKELSRVRTEVEQLQGRLRVLQDLTALSTVTISVREVLGFVPDEIATFGTQIRRTWQKSIDGLTAAAKVAVLTAVACAPWLIAVGLPLVLVILTGRRWRRRKQPPRTHL